MSYILDALKRADTERERERGRVPGLHSQNLPGGNLHRGRQRQPPVKRHRALWLGALLSAAVLALVWWRMNAEAPPTPLATQSAPSSPMASAPEPSMPLPEPADAPATVARAPELPILAPAPPPPLSPTPQQPARTERKPAPAAIAPAMAPAPNPAGAAPAASDLAAAPASSPVRRFAELPADFRAQLPQVNINGSTYSSNPAQRTLIANGKMVQEGDEIAPGLQLETIGQRSAVLNYRGTRYSIGY